ncbi:Na/Pi cotransporter family protein [Muricoccus aerilatus]|uniref:Na/Pi cotransporter family protein n=1 Tax=Muricoccus aerilatus TaxID=452982 RepID=UPI0005C15C4C|nr:Na/Pi symporter [Roseomonas aerilata]
MQADIFRDIVVPVIGGLGIFMLGLEFMSNGIQSLAVNKMRALLARIAGTPIKGVVAGTLITGVIQSSTAMTVMVVGLVNAGVIGLRPAISVIMGANIGTTLGNGLIALPLGPLGLLLAGFFALIHVFSKNDRVRNIALTCMGFALIFYGLNLMTGGLRPLRGMPEVMGAISALRADSFMGLVYCVLIAAGITAMIHSSSATIGIVMGLGAAGVLDWQTAVAFSLGADLGTTITSWIASLNLSKNAKRAAYAHISFNIIGVAVMLPLFFPSMLLLRWVMGWFGGDPGVPQMIGDRESFPLVPVAVGLYSTAFNLFNTALLFPFVGVFDRILSRIGHDSSEDVEDYSVPRFLDASHKGDLGRALPAVQAELSRYLRATTLFLATARGASDAPKHPAEHHAATDILSRDIRAYAAGLFRPDMPYAQADLVASLIEEADFSASLGDTLFQTARRVEREEFSPAGRAMVQAVLERIAEAMSAVNGTEGSWAAEAAGRMPALAELRERCLRQGVELSSAERGSILTLLGSAERAFVLIERIDAERRSVARVVQDRSAVPERKLDLPPAGAAVPA